MFKAMKKSIPSKGLSCSEIPNMSEKPTSCRKAFYLEANPRSKVKRKGRSGLMRDFIYVKGRYWNIHQYAILRKDFAKLSKYGEFELEVEWESE